MAVWQNFGIAVAPNPDDKAVDIQLAVSAELVAANSDMNKMTPLLQIWCHVFGVLPELPNISKVRNAENTPTLSTLKDSAACFRGIERPHDDEDNGDSVICYVLNPATSIEFSPSQVCVAQPVIMPQQTAITVLVRIKPTLLRPGLTVDGILTRIEPVKCSPEDPLLPNRYKTRYRERLW